MRRLGYLLLLLSICIPTHDGRGWSLRETLNSIERELSTGDGARAIEVCISDNASNDDTQRVVAEFQEKIPGTISYHRFPLDVGPYNFLNSVRMATGDYCWFMGSDDILEEGSIRNIFAILDEYPGTSGITAAYEKYSFDLSHIVPGHPKSYFPDGYDTERRFSSFSEAIEQLGLSQTFMSVQVFRRSLWEDVVATEMPEMLRYTKHHLHTYALGAIMKRDPNWVWSPRVLVKMRSDNDSSFVLTTKRSYGHPLMVLRDMTSIWSRLCFDDRGAYLKTLGKAYRVTWSPQVVRHLKMLSNHTFGDDLAMLAGFTACLWPLPQFWFGSFPALLIPSGFWKLLHRSGLLSKGKRLLRGTNPQEAPRS